MIITVLENKMWGLFSLKNGMFEQSTITFHNILNEELTFFVTLSLIYITFFSLEIHSRIKNRML